MKDFEKPTVNDAVEDDTRFFINVARGLAIFLMLWGHCIQCCCLGDFDFYENDVFRVIYSFHMPLFMLISGYLNTAAGAMFFPIMYEAATQLGYEPYPFLIALMISVSSSFATPIGSPTHMLVYAPGGYRFSDFMRVGLLMNIIILAANIFIVNVVYPLTPLQ